MKHCRCFPVYVVVLAIVVFSCMLITPNTHVSAQGTPSPTKNYCVVQMVHLNGKNPPTTTCLRQSVPPGQVILAAGSDCSSSTLTLGGADLYGDLELCFLGTGFVNLTDYVWRVPLVGGTWDNRAQWYSTGCNSGTFYADINGSGTLQKFGTGEEANFDGQNGRLSNLTLSSFQITSSC